MTSVTPDVRDEEHRLAALAALDLLDTPAEERFDRVTRLCTRLFGVSKAAVTLVDRDRTWLKSAAGMDTGELPREQSFCDVTVRAPEPLVVPDAQQDPRFAGLDLVAGPAQLRFYAGAPLEGANGARVGALCLFDEQPRTLTPSEQSLLTELAGWVQREMVVDEELERAAEVQRGLWPSGAAQLPGYQLDGVCLTSRQVGGDLYDWYRVPAGTAVTVADVMGKGMPAAIVMAALRAVLRAGSRTGSAPDAVALAADAVESDFGATGAFVTLFHGVLDAERGVLRYVDAGHGLALLVHPDGSTSRPEVRGLPAGAVPGTTWTEGELALGPGDTLVVHSDGLLDLHADRASLDRQVVEAVRSGETVAQVLQHLTWAVRQIKLPDDVTVVVLRRDA